MTDKLQKLMMLNGIESVDKPDPVAEVNAKLDGLMTYMGLSGHWNGQVFEVVKEQMGSGDYTNPILIPAAGLTTTAGLWYYVDDPQLPHEALQDAFVTPDDFYDRTWFDYV